MKSRRPSPGLTSTLGLEESPSPSNQAPDPRGSGRQAYGNAALAEELAAKAAQGGEESQVAMGRGRAAGMLAGFGMAAANALGGGGLPAMLNPSGYWDTMPESPRRELILPGPAARLKPAD
jgi:hypothetical protein